MAPHALHDAVDHLVEVAEKGESNATPALMLGGLVLVLVPLVAVVVTVALATAHFATRDEGKAQRRLAGQQYGVVGYAVA